MENCNFPRVFFHIFIIFHVFLSVFFIFASSSAKNCPKNGKFQFSSSFFHFLIIFLSCFYHVSSFLHHWKQNNENWWKMMKKYEKMTKND
jgi:hypothetical protein